MIRVARTDAEREAPFREGVTLGPGLDVERNRGV